MVIGYPFGYSVIIGLSSLLFIYSFNSKIGQIEVSKTDKYHGLTENIF